ncbi:MAG: DUF2971 domain-containing protein [Proteobacteria bacterium]|nr:DUF2971 domain-containing protein [Pseudomonadota bacterium]
MRAEVIYRYVSFFDLYNLLEHGKLRISQATSFDDKNEGFGFVLRQSEGKYLAALGPSMCFDGAKIVKTLTYISCWTIESNKIAMWLLYSKDSDGFRIRTTRTKLKSVLADYRKSYAFSPERIQDFSPIEGDNVFDVTYENFRETKEELETRNRDIEKELDSLPDTLSKVKRIRLFSKVARATLTTLKFTDNPWFYKDKAYDHENEVRAVIEFEAANEEGNSLAGDLTEFTSRFPSSINVDIPDDFIEDICIDERCLPFKKAVFKSFLLKYGYALSESRAFSSLFDR